MKKSTALLLVPLCIIFTLVLIFSIKNQWHRSQAVTIDDPDLSSSRALSCRIVNGFPDSLCTSGAVNPNIHQADIRRTLCNPSWSTKSIRPPSTYTNSLKKSQMELYGLTGPTSDYEEDHLISIEDGGDPRDPRNLWPEPNHLDVQGYDLGAKTKDKLENVIHKLICSGKITLPEGQEMLRNDWVAAYQKYIGPLPHMDQPLGGSDGDDE